jgi:tetratricopeptide (TPR) repeat protein
MNAGYWVSVARAQLALNQSAAARESVDKALALAPEWLPVAGLAAMLDVSEGRIESALKRVLVLKAGSPQDAQVLLLEGDVRVAARQYPEAAEAFEAAGRLRPTGMAALKAFAARQLAGMPDPTDPLRRWLQREPSDVAVRFALAEAYQESSPTKAMAEYEGVLQYTPRSAVALNNLAWLYQAAGDERALATARKAHELAPAVPAIADTYGWILLENGRIPEAVAVLKVAAQGSDNAQIQAHYAEALKRARADRAPL